MNENRSVTTVLTQRRHFERVNIRKFKHALL